MTTRPPIRKPVPKSAVKTRQVMGSLSIMSAHEDEHHEEPNEKWLVSYADMMTLLFGFFVLLYSMSNVDQNKFAQAAQSASERFGKEDQSFGGKYQDPTEMLDRKLAKEIKAEPSLMNDVEVKKGAMGLELSFRGKALFESSSAQLSPLGKHLIVSLGEEMKKSKVKYDIKVEGHTDDLPISTLQFPSNWELSAARAISVIKLFKDMGIEPSHLEAVGYADTRPIAQNRSPAGEGVEANRALNRRVVIKLQRIFQK